MTGSSTDRRAGLMACAAIAALFCFTGCTSGGTPESGATGEVPVASASTSTATPVPSTSAAAPVPSPTAASAAASGPAQKVLAASDPQSLSIPATGTRSELLHLGLREDGSLEVPPEPPGSPAGWYDGSPTPGERGPAVLLGHVNATGGGPGVFADLRQLRPGDTIEVARQDGSTATFTVDRGEAYAKDEFPTLKVYGNTPGAELRLITCDGYDPATGNFGDNYVVYATLTT
ncbi:class F sortase [Kocuria sp. WRN011]|uniref:Class F sortase n=1 Tax=Kocuria carniphila TaxID=262208 RepID=A0ABV3V683_9MICC|nr:MULTISPECIES: class F sortase [Bacteria]MBD2763312.1 class F sortase [Kocuria sp. cx-116]MBD2765694.1 class F sortase [Kocuria sp. cx-455]PBB07627.1 class F sortase [Kocuria sp. WRN011]